MKQIDPFNHQRLCSCLRLFPAYVFVPAYVSVPAYVYVPQLAKRGAICTSNQSNLASCVGANYAGKPWRTWDIAGAGVQLGRWAIWRTLV